MFFSFQQVVESDFLLFFDCSEEIMQERLLKRSETSGRPDDNIETIQKRFATFVEKTLPVVGHYEELNKLNKVGHFLFSPVMLYRGRLVSLRSSRTTSRENGTTL